jgi:hypothetical protein
LHMVQLICMCIKVEYGVYSRLATPELVGHE